MELKHLKTEMDVQLFIAKQLQEAVLHLANISKQLTDINMELKLTGGKSRS